MTDARRTLSWLLLLLVGVVTAGGAFLAVYYAPSQPATSLNIAAKNTTAATSYTEDLKQVSTANGTGLLHVVLQAPDRLAGYEQATGRRSYLVVAGNTVYQSVATSITSSITSHRFYVQHVSDPISQVDPLPSYLSLVSRAKAVHRDGSVYSFTLATTTGKLAQLHYTVTGEYVSRIDVNIPGSITRIDLTRINSSPPVELPAQSSIRTGSPIPSTPTTTAPPSTTPTTTAP
jgi:hypothetical protein